MKFHVQASRERTTRPSAKEQLDKGLRRIQARYSGKEGEARLLQVLTRSLSWTMKWAVLGAGALCIDGVILCALFATTDDWKMLADALHTVTAENINNFLHHDLLPELCFDFVKLWAARVGLELMAVGFSPFYPNGGFEPRVERGTVPDQTP